MWLLGKPCLCEPTHRNNHIVNFCLIWERYTRLPLQYSIQHEFTFNLYKCAFWRRIIEYMRRCEGCWCPSDHAKTQGACPQHYHSMYLHLLFSVSLAFRGMYCAWWGTGGPCQVFGAQSPLLLLYNSCLHQNHQKGAKGPVFKSQICSLHVIVLQAQWLEHEAFNKQSQSSIASESTESLCHGTLSVSSNNSFHAHSPMPGPSCNMTGPSVHCQEASLEPFLTFCPKLPPVTGSFYLNGQTNHLLMTSMR